MREFSDGGNCGVIRVIRGPIRTPLSTLSAAAEYARGEPILRMTGVDGQHASAGFALP